MSNPVSPAARRGWFAATWLATLFLTFWLGARWTHPRASDGSKIPPATTVPTNTVATSEAKKGGLDPADPAQVTAGLDRGVTELGDYRKQAHLARVAARLDLEEVTTALDAEEARGALEVRHEIIEALLARFAEIDPAAATVRATQLYEKLGGYPSWIETTLAVWWKRDAHAARVWADGLPPGRAREDAREDLAEFLAASDPEEAFRQGFAQKDGPLNSWDVGALFQSLAKGNLALAAERARALPQRGNQDDAVEGVLKVWVTRDPAAAYTWATTTAKGHSERVADVKNFYEYWSQQDPAAAAAWALAHELAPGARGDWNNSGFDEIIEHLAGRDLATAQSFVVRLPAWAQQGASQELCKDWRKKEPVGAADYALSLGGGKDGGASELTLNCVKNWVTENLPDARAWVERMPPGKARGEAMAAVCGKWQEKDPKGCVDYLLAHQADFDEPLAKNTSFQGAAGAWAEDSPDEMLHWSQGLPDADVRDAVLKEAARLIADDDLPKATQMVAAISPAGRGDAVDEMVGSLESSGHTLEAKALVETLPDDKTATEATESFARQWGKDDPAAAAAWVATRPAGPTRDAAAAVIAGRVMEKQDIAAAERTMALVQAPKQKIEALEDVAGYYVEKDRAAAKAWIASSPLFTPKLRAKWLRQAEKSKDDKEDDDEDE